MSAPAPLPLNLPHKNLRLPGGISNWELLGIVLALGVGFHFLALRILAGGLPGGDEGSWMSVAAELSRGHGYTTRWLEAHFLRPYTLPRPDDFRYPALTTLLALVYQFTGISVEAARWAVAGIFLAFSLVTYFVCRFSLGSWAAMAGLWLMVCSLLQLDWNSLVFTEGLFGLTLSLLLAWCLWGEASKRGGIPWGFQTYRWWMVLGLGIGLLYFVRANGILFLPGIAWLYWRRRHLNLNWRHPALAMAIFFVCVSPWLIRAEAYFGNPFHIAGSAGMLRDIGQSHTQSLSEYFSKHEVLFPLKRIGIGACRFFAILHQFEHGLEIIPLILALLAIVRRQPFFSPIMTLGFGLTGLASIYAAYDSWAGIRYMSALLPFVYIYGLAQLPNIMMRISPARFPRALPLLSLPLLLLPVLYPHRYYERHFTKIQEQAGSYPYLQEMDTHLNQLRNILPPTGYYFAGSLCNVNFLAPDRNCIGLQELYDPTWFSRSMAAFNPNLIVLTIEEAKSEKMLQALEFMHSEGYRQDTVKVTPLALYLSLQRQ